MPASPVHKEKLKKNLVVLALIIGFMAMIWAITILKIKEYGVSVE